MKCDARDGATFDPVQDTMRLNQQATDVWAYMRDGCWHTLRAISQHTGHPEASVSARLRDFRKERFGTHTVERRHTLRLFVYRVVPNPTAALTHAGFVFLQRE